MKIHNMLLCMFLLAAISCNLHSTEPRNSIGLPATSGSDRIISHCGFTLSFNKATLCPDWVAWELTAGETVGSASRKNYSFMDDESVERRYRVGTYDYTSSGYDRGHMYPAGDAKWSEESMHDCHYMTNICPQEHELNQRWWEHLESACRRWAKCEGSIYIVSGPIFDKHPKRIGREHAVAVPKAFFKVILSMKQGEEKAIGFYYTNDEQRQPMEAAVRSVDEIEKLTGIDFFPLLPDNLESKLEAHPDLRRWN